MNKKGQLYDILVPVISLLLLVLLFIAGSYGLTIINADPNVPATIKNTTGSAQIGIRAFNSVGLLFIVGMGIALIGSAFFIRTMPALFFVFFILQLCVVVISFMFSNVFFTIMGAPTGLASEAASFDQWVLVFKYYPTITLVLSMIFAIAFFAKSDG